MGRKKNYRPLIALAALAVAALALATLTFTNVTYWLINATLPPAMKYAGPDAEIGGRADGSGYGRYVYVSYYYDPSTGYNVTRISIVGFTGDPTNYTDVLRLCNKYYSGTLYVRLVAVGSIGGQAPQYVRDFRVYFADPTADPNYVQFQGASVVQSATGWVAIGPGQCATVGAYVLIDPTLPPQYRDGKTIIAQYEIHVAFSTQPTGFAPPPPTGGGGQLPYCRYGFDQQPAWVKFYVYDGNSKAYLDADNGYPAPSAYLEGQNGWGAVFINVSAWLGPVSVDNAFSSQIFMWASIGDEDYIQIHFFIDTDGDGRPDLEKVYYYSHKGRTPTPIAQTVYGYALPITTVLLGTWFPAREWTTVSIVPGGVGYVVGYAVAINSPNGDTKGRVDNIEVC